MTTAGVSAGSLKTPGFLRKAGHEDINKVLDQKEESFSARLLRLIDEKGLKDSAVYKSANIDRRLFSRIRSNEDYMPSKKTAISFCLALQLEMFLGANMDAAEEAEKLGIRKSNAASYKNDSRGVQLNYQAAGNVLSCMRLADYDDTEMASKIADFLRPVKEHLEEDGACQVHRHRL